MIIKNSQSLLKGPLMYMSIVALCAFVSCDSVQDRSEALLDTVRVYYDDGTLKYEYSIKDTLMDGYLKKYYPEGQLMAHERYESGKRKGDTEYFYENSSIKEQVRFVNGEPFGHAYFYYEDGILRTYSSFDFEGHPRYVRKYDLEGKVVQDEGQVLGQLFVTENDSLRLLFSYAHPPDTKAVVQGHVKQDSMTEVIDVALLERVGEIVLSHQVDEVRIIGKLVNTKTGELITIDTLYHPDSLYPPNY